MNTNKVILILLVIALGVFAYYTYTAQNRVEDSLVANETTDTKDTQTVEDDTELAEGEELPPELAVYEGWEQVEEEGYYFMHPGHFIKEENGYYIIAYEPVEGAEFSSVTIRQPFDAEDIMVYMNQTIDDSNNNVGINVTSEPRMVIVEGTKAAYSYEYETESGYNMGPQTFVALQSPSTDQWVAIQYPSNNETAENIARSFNFID